MSENPNTRSLVVDAMWLEAGRRLAMAEVLGGLDDEVFAVAVETMGSPGAAGEWLITGAFGLGGKIPAELCANSTDRAQVIQLLRRIDRGVVA